MNQISITKIKSSLPNPSPLWGEGKGEGRLGHLEIRGLGFGNWDLRFRPVGVIEKSRRTSGETTHGKF
jgi:hypothetical protein